MHSSLTRAAAGSLKEEADIELRFGVADTNLALRN
jgi:hypothetical protein